MSVRILLLLLAVPITANATMFAPGSIWVEAGRQYGISAELLYSVALQESKLLRDSSSMSAWPWTLRVGSKAYRYDSEEEAKVALRELMDSGVAPWTVDIGMMQLNAKWVFYRRGYDKIYKIEDLLSPQINVGIAARILKEGLSKKGLNEAERVGYYHSIREPIRSKYGKSVLEIMDSLKRVSPGRVSW